MTQPIINKLLGILLSRRVLTALGALLVGVITFLVPELQAVQDELLILIVSVSLALIGGFSFEEAARISKERAGQDDQQLRELIKELLSELFEEMMQEEQKEEKSSV